ncbi:MAG: hypothetical protein MI750_04215 [Xanthomonadales bacterium]|nr:hypothetical protein [Xanthomonadales bacterium]
MLFFRPHRCLLRPSSAYLALIVAMVSFSQSSAAQNTSQGGGFEIARYTIDAGGGTAQAGNFQVQGTIGQSDTATLSAGDFQLRGGFWVPAQTDVLFEDGYES